MGEAVAAARSDAIVQEMTALPWSARVGPGSGPGPVDRYYHPVAHRGIDHLLAAAAACGVSLVVAQSLARSFGNPEGGWVTEEEPLPAEAMEPKMRQAAAALRHVEDMVASTTVLAVEQRVNGVFDIVGDQPARSEIGGEDDDRGPPFSNAKAKRELGWGLRYPSWR